MTYKKFILSSVLFLGIYLNYTLESHAASTIDNVSVFYKNEEGRNLVVEKANDISKELNEIDAIVGNFTSNDLKELEQSPDIEVVEKDQKKLQIQATPTALPFKNNTINWNQTLVNANKAWSIGLSGANIKVGIIDTVVASHKSLPTVKKTTFISDTSDINTLASAAKHGTFVAGIIAAQPTSNSNVIGVAPNVTLYSMNINGKTGADLVDFIAAIDYAIEQKLQVVNISMGIPKKLLLDEDEKLSNSPLYLAVKKALNAGIIIVSASGNNGVDVDYPAAIDGVIAVGSVSSNKKISYFSNAGKTLSVVAPGSDVESLSYAGGVMKNSGTSFAAPHVTGLIALLKQQYPTESNEKIKKRLFQNAVDLGDKGFDNIYGNGLAVFPEVNLVNSAVTTTESSAQKYVRVNKSKISTIMKKLDNGKKIDYLTEFTPLYTVESSLTASQQKKLKAYRVKSNVEILSNSLTSSKATVTNITTIKSVKESKITFDEKINIATVKAKSFSMYKDGAKLSNYTLSIAKSGSYLTLKTTKALTKGKYYFSIDTTSIRTTSNKKVKPIIIQYTVK